MGTASVDVFAGVGVGVVTSGVGVSVSVNSPCVCLCGAAEECLTATHRPNNMKLIANRDTATGFELR